ncbi:MAG: serine protease, partial [Acetobacteraceae bacterium]
MRLTLPDMIGLLIGFALGGLGLLLFLPGAPEAPPADQAPTPAVVRPEKATPPPDRSAVRMPPPQAIAPAPAPIAVAPRMPDVVRPGIHGDARGPHVTAMPHVIRPTDRTKQVGLSGTGFFIASDGLLLTAAHVVDGCRTTQITSRDVGMAAARVLATDSQHDLALLRAQDVRPPALLSFAAPPAAGAGLTVFGYPSGADTQVPTEARGTLRNDQAAAPPNQRPDPRDFVLIEAGSVRQGFSGGPIIGPGGRVFGMLKGIVVNRDHGPSERVRPTGMAIGAGTRPIGT